MKSNTSSFIALNSLTSNGYYGVNNEEISTHYLLNFNEYSNSIKKNCKLDLQSVYNSNKDLVVSAHFKDDAPNDILLKDEKNKYLIHFTSDSNPLEHKMRLLFMFPTSSIIEDMKNYLEDFIKPYVIEDEDSKSVVYFITHNGGGYDLNDYDFPKPVVNIDLNYGDGFKDIHDKIVSILKQKKTGLLIFHSVPGTGKSKYIQTLTDHISDKKFIYLNSELFSAFDSPQFTSFALSELKDTVLILEDCENIVTSREINKNNNVISTLLNLTSGIFADVLNCKIICTFNTAAENIDPALLRKGRLLYEHEFRPLTPDEANKLHKEIHGSDKETPFDKDVTLSEVYNIEDVKSAFKKERRRIGF
jgi:ATP-dependent 26S proteasome regulatory subunit